MPSGKPYLELTCQDQPHGIRWLSSLCTKCSSHFRTRTICVRHDLACDCHMVAISPISQAHEELAFICTVFVRIADLKTVSRVKRGNTLTQQLHSCLVLPALSQVPCGHPMSALTVDSHKVSLAYPATLSVPVSVPSPSPQRTGVDRPWDSQCPPHAPSIPVSVPSPQGTGVD